jgi:putative SOS response-associated peptidase YedK
MVLEKPSFSYHVMHRRCVIVARHFYEWDRMPLILKEQDLQNWICEDLLLKDFLSQPSPMLERKQDYEQLTLL